MKIKPIPQTQDLEYIDDLIKIYSDRAASFSKLKQNLEKQCEIIAWSRLFLALISLSSLYKILESKQLHPWGILFLLFALLFSFAVVLNKKQNRKIDRFKFLEKINLESIHRIERKWNDLEIPRYIEKDDSPHFLLDMNLVGKGSLLQLIGTLKTPAGIDKFLDWISQRTKHDEALKRQEAVKELSDQLDLRQEVYSLCDSLSGEADNWKIFFDWTESEEVDDMSPYGYLLVCLLTLVTPIALVSVFINPAYGIMWTPLVCINLLLSANCHKKQKTLFANLHGIESQLGKYIALIELVLGQRPESVYIKELKDDLVSSSMDAKQEIQKLQSLVGWAGARNSGILYLILQGNLLWDFHLQKSLIAWQKRCRDHARKWFDAITKYEVIASLASLPYDNPKWSYPSIEETSKKIVAKQIGHPLISDKSRVSNDIDIGPNGKFLLVTGSNMSGKSTLLRSIGLNALLARTGAPVCAASLILPPVDLVTSFKVNDSLADGVSLYMAELKHIKRVIDLIKSNHEKGVITLYLFDEILQGTNSRERQITVASITAQLLALNVIGAISTHDLELAKVDNLKGACDTVHFKEKLLTDETGTTMSFDYLLCPGISNTTNALELLKAVGLKLS
jgi:DNA mismatch repair ATPase MutS